MAGRVAIITPDGKFGTIDAEHEESLVRAGGRVLSKKEVAAQELADEYAAKPTAEKVAGLASSTLAGPIASGALSATGKVAVQPEVEAALAGAASPVTLGADRAIAKATIGATEGPEAAKAYGQRQSKLDEAHGDWRTAGEVAGFAAQAIGGSGSGLARAVPGLGMSALGGAAEAGAAKMLGGLAAKGVLGRAAATGASLAVRGAVEGAAYSGATTASDSYVKDEPLTGEKLYTAMGHGALAGAVFGGGLGTTGSLSASGVKGIYGAATRGLARAGSKAEQAALAEAARGVPVEAVDVNAGLREPMPAAESPFVFGPEKRPVQLRPDVGARGRVAADEPFSIARGLKIDPDAGLHAPEGATLSPLSSLFKQGATKAERRAAVEAGLHEGAELSHEVKLDGSLLEPGKVKAGPRPVESRFEIGFDPEAGMAKRAPSGRFQGAVEATDALKLSSAKNVARDVSLGDVGGLGAVEAKAPIKIGGTETAAAAGEKLGVLDLLNRPSDAARALAQDQAWNAVGAGFGLQSTRHAKEAARYFPGGTRDLGEIAIRYGAIDIPQGGSPFQAAVQAAKSGAVGEILPKLEMADARVGSRIGEITESSGARIPLDEVRGAIAKVRAQYSRIAGYEHVVNALDVHEQSLLSKLAGAPDGTASVQQVLEQRKGLDKLVYEETKTLDPKGRVAALREVRGELEGVITKALDDASGRVPGELRAEYQALKKDFHGLRILKEAAEDSAARTSKAGTLGIKDLLLGGGGLSGTAMALGGKILRERGNAAAAAFLSRAADSGALARMMRETDELVKRSAKGVLRDGSDQAPKATGKAAKTDGHAQVAATQEQAGKIVRWAGDVRANPQRVMDQLKESAETIGRTAGPQAANAYTANTLKALNFIVAHIPVKERRDPLDPTSVPPLTFEEADRVLRATRYATEPKAIWADFDRGIVTTEGVAAAKEFQAEQFASFQADLMTHTAEHLSRSKQLSASQRLRIDRLLGFGAGRPEEIASLQANLMQAPTTEPPPAPAAPTGNKPVNLKVQQSGFDAVEARKTA